MKLSNVKEGTPVRVKAFKDGEKIAEIWGKMIKTGNESSINVYYYEGMNINLTSPEYELQTTAFDESEEYEIDMSETYVKDTENLGSRLIEKRDSFRIYISSVVDCVVAGEDTAGLLVDLSENGFKIAVMGNFKKNQTVELFIDEEDLKFSIKGTIVWTKPVSDVRCMCGCIMLPDQNREEVLKYIQKKQLKMFEDLKKEIAKGKSKDV